MPIILGIGNIGAEYVGTRHNVGFAVLDLLAQRAGVSTWTRKWQSDVADWRRDQNRILLVKPRTFVNRSGEAAQAILAFHKLPVSDLLVIVDDIHLPVGNLRARAEGSAGGHNGLRDIESRLGTVYPRLRLGVGAPNADADQIAHVLGGFHPDERDDAQAMIIKAADAAQAWLDKGMDGLLAFNGPLRPPPPRPKPVRPAPPPVSDSLAVSPPAASHPPDNPETKHP